MLQTSQIVENNFELIDNDTMIFDFTRVLRVRQSSYKRLCETGVLRCLRHI